MSTKDKIDKWFSQYYPRLQREVRNNIAIDGMREYADDLLSICTEAFLTRPEDQQEQMLQDNKVENFILRCCSFQLKSGNSPLYNQFRKHKMRSRSGWTGMDLLVDEDYVDYTQTELYECFSKAKSELHWYYQRLLDMKYNEGMSYSEIRMKTGITLNSLQKDMAIAYQIIRQKCKHCT